MPKVFDLEWDRMEEYRLEQAVDEEEPDEDAMMDLLARMNERTGVGSGCGMRAANDRPYRMEVRDG